MKTLLFAVLVGLSFAATAQPASRTGQLAILHSDDFDNAVATQDWVVHEDNGRDTKVDFTNRHNPKVGQRVTVLGNMSGGRLQATTLNVQADAAVLPTGSQNAIFILVEWSDTGSVPFAQSAVQTTVTNNVQPFFNEVSLGKQQLAVTVTPWLRASIATPSTCDYTSMGNAGDAAATAAGYNLSNYVNKFYVMPHNSACGWAGLAYVGAPYTAWSNGYNTGQVFDHELGHNFGLLHSGSVAGVGPGQSVAEYGDPASSMGNQANGHYTGMQKNKLGWASAVTAGAGTNTYNISALEVTGSQYPYVIKVPTTSSARTYWVELRAPIGFDAAFNGVTIHLGTPFESSSGADDTEAFQINASWYLPVSSTYTDNTYGVSVTVNSVSGNVANITVGAPVPTVSCNLTASSLSPAINTQLTLTDTCTGSPTTYSWTGCTSTTSKCTTTASVVGPVTYSVLASNGTSNANKSITVTWSYPAKCVPRGNSGKCR